MNDRIVKKQNRKGTNKEILEKIKDMKEQHDKIRTLLAYCVKQLGGKVVFTEKMYVDFIEDFKSLEFGLDNTANAVTLVYTGVEEEKEFSGSLNVDEVLREETKK